jgi:hypothetical protein
MMNAREKSDSAIVAEKSWNKTGSRKVTPDTETMERRAEAKENAKQQSTRRRSGEARANVPESALTC